MVSQVVMYATNTGMGAGNMKLTLACACVARMLAMIVIVMVAVTVRCRVGDCGNDRVARYDRADSIERCRYIHVCK